MVVTGDCTITSVSDGGGVSVAKVVNEYTVSTSSSSLPPDPVWTEAEPSIASGEYLWIRQRTDFSDGTSAYGNAICSVNMSGLITAVDTNTQSITNKVWSTDINTAINTYDGTTAATIRDRVTATEVGISGITTRVSDVETGISGISGRMSVAESNITQNATNISTKVSQDGVISAINQSAETISILANKLDIATLADGGVKIHAPIGESGESGESGISGIEDYVLINPFGVSIYDEGIAVSQFNTDGVLIGPSDSQHVEIVDGAISMYTQNLVKAVDIGSSDTILTVTLRNMVNVIHDVVDGDTEPIEYTIPDDTSTTTKIRVNYQAFYDSDGRYPINYNHVFDYGTPDTYITGVFYLNYDGVKTVSIYAHNSSSLKKLGLYAVDYNKNVYAPTVGLGLGLTASGASQTVVGKYNVEDTNDEYAFIVGIGTNEDSLSNGFVVDWTGNIKMRMRTTGDDTFLHYAIQDLGWTTGVTEDTSYEYEKMLNIKELLLRMLKVLHVDVVYENTSGKNEDFFLPGDCSAANYDCFIIYYKDNDNVYSSTRVYQPNGKTVVLQNVHSNIGKTYVYMKTSCITISGTSITFNRQVEGYINSSNQQAVNERSYIYITRIEGYKYPTSVA